MKRSRKQIAMYAAGTVIVLAALALAGCGNGASNPHQASAKMDIVETAIAADDFNTLVAAVKAADLVETLQSDGPFTVFAPTDQAFAKLPHGTLDSLLEPGNRDKLRAILTYHVVGGKVMAEDVVKLHSAKTVQGQSVDIRVSHGQVMVDEARVIKTDILCSNGVIHVIDSVITP